MILVLVRCNLPDAISAKIFIFITLVYEVYHLQLVFKLQEANKQAISKIYENAFPIDIQTVRHGLEFGSSWKNGIIDFGDLW